MLGAGWNKPLSEKFVFELAPEIAFYGDNRDYLNTHTLGKDATFALNTTLRYRATPSFHVFGGMQFNRGGETAVDRTERDDAANTDRASLGMLFITPSNHIWSLRYSHDTCISNGYRTEDELALRWQVPF